MVIAFSVLSCDLVWIPYHQLFVDGVEAVGVDTNANLCGIGT
jgi:hypothetical protein